MKMFPMKAEERDEATRKEADALARQAEKEMRTNGIVTTICPHCKKVPRVNIEPGRLLVICDCHFIYNSEIYD